MENSSNQNNSANNTIDVSFLWRQVRRNWLFFVISVVVCLVLAGIYLYAKHPVYDIRAKVLVAYDAGTGSMGSTLMQSLSLEGVGGSSVEDEILVMDAHSIKTQAISELKLNRSYSSPVNFLKKRYYYNDSPIEVSAQDELFDTLSTGLRFKISVNKDASKVKVKVKKRSKTLNEVEGKGFPLAVSTPYGTFSIDTTSNYVAGKALTINASVAGNSLLAEGYDENISIIKSEKKANGISLFIEDIDIQRGTDMLDKIIELYNRRGQQEKDEMAINTANFIKERLDSLFKELSISETDIQNYKQDNNIVNIEAETAFLMEQKGTVEEALITAETNYEILRMTKDFLDNPANNYSLIPFPSEISGSSEAIQSYNELILQRMNLELNAKGKNAALKTLNEQIDAMRDNIKSSINRSVANAYVTLNELRKKSSESEGRLVKVPNQEREFQGLYREYLVKNTLYSYLLQKREENQLVLAATTPKGKIIDKAYAMNMPVSPHKFTTLLLAFVIGLIIPALWLYLKQSLTNTFETQEDLSRLTPLPIAGEICHSRSAKEKALVVDNVSRRSVVELFRLLRSNLQFMMPSHSGCKVIMVTSSSSGEGKTFISMNLAETIALGGNRVVLVGLDIRLPKIAQYLDVPDAPGVTNYLSNSLDSVDSMISHVTDIDVIVGGPIPPNPAELLMSDRLGMFIDELKSKYDYVILDTAPIAMVSDSLSIAKHCDMTLYVTRVNYTKKQLLKYLNTIVDRGQLKNVAIVLNDTNMKQSYGYGYGYGSSEE